MLSKLQYDTIRLRVRSLLGHTVLYITHAHVKSMRLKVNADEGKTTLI